MSPNQKKKHSATGTRTRVARARAEYPSQLDYSGCCINSKPGPLQQLHVPRRTNVSAQQANMLASRRIQSRRNSKSRPPPVRRSAVPIRLQELAWSSTYAPHRLVTPRMGLYACMCAHATYSATYVCMCAVCRQVATAAMTIMHAHMHGHTGI